MKIAAAFLLLLLGCAATSAQDDCTRSLHNLNYLWHSACVMAATTDDGKRSCDHFYTTMMRVIAIPEPPK